MSSKVKSEVNLERFPIKKGDYVHRKNLLAIGKKIAIEANHIKERHHKDGIVYTVNGKGGATGFIEHLVIVSREEAERLNALYSECQVSESVKPGISTSCIREDNGEPKQKHNARSVLPVLFRYRQLYPEKNFEAYKCTICGWHHIGKRLDEETEEQIEA